MNVNVMCKENIALDTVKRINQLADIIVKEYEEMLGKSYGAKPHVFVIDEEYYKKYIIEKSIQRGFASDKDGRFMNFLKKIWRNVYSEMARVYMDFYNDYSSFTAAHVTETNDILLKDVHVKTSYWSYYLAHELAHAHKDILKHHSDKKNTAPENVKFSINEGIIEYLACAAFERLHLKGLVTQKEFKTCENHISILQDYHPNNPKILWRSNIGIKIMDYSIGYFYVKDKMDSGLPVSDILSLYLNMPKRIDDMHIPRYFPDSENKI